MDTDKIAGILIDDSGERRELSLTAGAQEKKDTQTEENPATQAQDTPAEWMSPSSLPAFENGRLLSDLRLLYVRYDNVVLADKSSIYLWDARCGRIKELLSLVEYGFSWENGGEVSLGQASQILFLPSRDSSQVYLYDIANKEMLTLEAASFWPWPTHEAWLGNFRDITELIPGADEKYSAQAFSSQGKWYYLYSGDGSAQNMELRSQEIE